MPFYDNSSRNDLRTVYVDAWRRHKLGMPLEPLAAQVVTVIGEHPEYQALFDDPAAALAADFSPARGRVNPFLHLGLHLAIRDQVATDRPVGIRAAYEILARRRGRHEAEHAMSEQLAELLWQTDRSGLPPNIDVYLRRVQKLAR